MRLGLDQTRIVRMPEPIGSIAIGNSDIVGVSLYDLQTVLVTGRRSGTTNMLVMDTSGRVMQEADMTVYGRNVGEVTIVRRGKADTYNCVGRCRGSDAR